MSTHYTHQNTLRIEIIFSFRAIYYHRHGCRSNVLPKTHTYISKSHLTYRNHIFFPSYLLSSTWLLFTYISKSHLTYRNHIFFPSNLLSSTWLLFKCSARNSHPYIEITPYVSKSHFLPEQFIIIDMAAVHLYIKVTPYVSKSHFLPEQFIIIDMAAVQMFCLKLTPIYRNHTLRIGIIFSSRAIYYHRHGCCSNQR